MRDEHVHLLSDPAAVTAHWGQHFTKVFNVVSEFSPVVIGFPCWRFRMILMLLLRLMNIR